mgnify:CR=1 FL=1
MKLGKIIGTVISSTKLSCLERRKLLLLQPIDEQYRTIGKPIVAVDTVQAGEGNIVYFEGGKEAAQALGDWFNPCDASVIAIVDHIDTGAAQ